MSVSPAYGHAVPPACHFYHQVGQNAFLDPSPPSLPVPAQYPQIHSNLLISGPIKNYPDRQYHDMTCRLPGIGNFNTQTGSMASGDKKERRTPGGPAFFLMF